MHKKLSKADANTIPLCTGIEDWYCPECIADVDGTWADCPRTDMTLHVEDCPGDDTCSCSEPDAVNRLLGSRGSALDRARALEQEGGE